MSDSTSRTVARVMATLEQMGVAPHPLSNLELAHSLGIAPSSMHRLLTKLCAHGYLNREPGTLRYAPTLKLSEMGGRLAEIGGLSLPLRSLIGQVRAASGCTVAVWVAGSVHIRMVALLAGEERGPSSNEPGELQAPFSTPGLALATGYSERAVRELVTRTRRRRLSLGRRFSRVADVVKSIEQTRRVGHAVGYNLKGDGWAMLAWPIPIALAPERLGALSIGARVADMRRQEIRRIELVERLISAYQREIDRAR